MLGVPEAARAFQNAGITALIYDPRSVGQSDGTPRNDINPLKQVEDYSDALTFLGSLKSVDQNRMAIWGISLSGAVQLRLISEQSWSLPYAQRLSINLIAQKCQWLWRNVSRTASLK
jgi:alpha/beta superfamily hydrolase